MKCCYKTNMVSFTAGAIIPGSESKVHTKIQKENIFLWTVLKNALEVDSSWVHKNALLPFYRNISSTYALSFGFHSNKRAKYWPILRFVVGHFPKVRVSTLSKWFIRKPSKRDIPGSLQKKGRGNQRISKKITNNVTLGFTYPARKQWDCSRSRLFGCPEKLKQTRLLWAVFSSFINEMSLHFKQLNAAPLDVVPTWRISTTTSISPNSLRTNEGPWNTTLFLFFWSSLRTRVIRCRHTCNLWVWENARHRILN